MVYLGLPIKNGDFPWLCEITRWYMICNRWRSYRPARNTGTHRIKQAGQFLKKLGAKIKAEELWGEPGFHCWSAVLWMWRTAVVSGSTSHRSYFSSWYPQFAWISRIYHGCPPPFVPIWPGRAEAGVQTLRSSTVCRGEGLHNSSQGPLSLPTSIGWEPQGPHMFWVELTNHSQP